MSAVPRAADLSEGSVVANPRHVWIKEDATSVNPWAGYCETTTALNDDYIDTRIAEGAQVLRYGTEPAEVREEWAAELTGRGRTVSYTSAKASEHAEMIADSVMTHLADIADDPQRRAHDVDHASVVVREWRTYADGSQHISPWRHVRDGKPMEG